MPSGLEKSLEGEALAGHVGTSVGLSFLLCDVEGVKHAQGQDRTASGECSGAFTCLATCAHLTPESLQGLVGLGEPPASECSGASA